MPPWLEHLLSGLSPEGSAGGFLGSVATLIASVIVKVWFERRKLDKAMASIPPTVCPVTERRSEGTVIATARQIWDLEQEVLELRKRLGAVDSDRKAIAVDLSHTAAALNQSELRAEALAQELAGVRRHIESGYTRLTLPESGTGFTPVRTVVELDAREIEDKPTPTQGRARVRR